MRVDLNGQSTEIPEGATVADAIEAGGANPDQRGIAVAIDAEVIPRSAWQSTTLHPGQKVEILNATQGG